MLRTCAFDSLSVVAAAGPSTLGGVARTATARIASSSVAPSSLVGVVRAAAAPSAPGGARGQVSARLVVAALQTRGLARRVSRKRHKKDSSAGKAQEGAADAGREATEEVAKAAAAESTAQSTASTTASATASAATAETAAKPAASQAHWKGQMWNHPRFGVGFGAWAISSLAMGFGLTYMGQDVSLESHVVDRMSGLWGLIGMGTGLYYGIRKGYATKILSSPVIGAIGYGTVYTFGTAALGGLGTITLLQIGRGAAALVTDQIASVEEEEYEYEYVPADDDDGRR